MIICRLKAQKTRRYKEKMFYENRKIILAVLLVIALMGSFFMGKKVGAPSKSMLNSTVQKTENENQDTSENYNENIEVEGKGYSLNYSISDAILLNKGTMNLNINIQSNNNVKEVKVIAKNETNESLEIIPNASGNKNSLNYTINFDQNIKNIYIDVYPLTDQMARKSNLDLSNLPYKTTKLNIDSIKKQMIQNLSN